MKLNERKLKEELRDELKNYLNDLMNSDRIEYWHTITTSKRTVMPEILFIKNGITYFLVVRIFLLEDIHKTIIRKINGKRRICFVIRSLFDLEKHFNNISTINL